MLRGEESMGTLEEQLLEAGNALLLQQPPHLLSHLHRVGKLLGKVEQSPSKSMLDALSPTIKAVVKQQLLRNENEDVRVAVASCISEITRITAPVAPYEDNQMKEVFQLIVSSFENLSDNSSRSYSQRISILETVAKVRSCVVMLDLECDGLIIEMFQHFLKAVRDHHVENVFSNMETVMTLVLEESEEIRLDLISPLLASLKKDSQEVQPIARKLAESVIEKCSAKVKPCLLQAKNSMSFSFDDYSPIISTVCMEANVTVQEDHRCPGEQLAEGITDGATSGVTIQGDGDKLYVPSFEEVPQGEVNKERTAEIVEGEDRHAPVVDFGSGEDHHTPVVDLGLGEDHSHVPIETDHPIAMETDPVEENNPVRGVASETTEIEDNPHTPEKPAERNSNEENEEEDHLPSHYDDVANLGGGRADEPAPDSDCGKVEFISAQISKKRSKNLMKCTLPLVSSHSVMDKNDKAKHVSDEEGIKDLDKVAVHKDDEKEASQLSSSRTEPESEQEILISSSPRGSALDEGLSCKDMRSKKKNKSIKKGENVTATKKAKKAATSDSPPPARKAQVPIKTSRVERGASGSDSDTKVLKKSDKKTEARNYHARDGTLSKKNADGKKRVSDKDAGFPVKPLDEVKGYTPLEETPKTSIKRKRTPCKEKATDVKKYGEDLVGSRIKVWWPMDKIFYEGVVDSFDPKTKKHKVIYTDGDLEHLNLGEEKWELNKDNDDSSNEGQETEPVTAKITREMRKQKKAKSGSQPSDTEGKAANFRDGDASSSKYKGTATKSSRKSVDNSKDDVKLTIKTPRSSSKSEDVGGKSTKVGSKKSAGGKSERADNSEDEDSGSLKALVKFKLGTPTKVSKDKSKTASIGSGLKSNTSKSGCTKSSRNGGDSQKSIETKEKSTCMVVKASESGKVKSAESRRKGGKDTEERSRGKKRRRN